MSEENKKENEDLTQESENGAEGESNVARRLRLSGELNSNEPEPEVLTPTEPKGWLENFWYHYKWTVIIVSFFVIVGVTVISQYVSRAHPDVNIIYAGPDYITANENRDFCKVLEGIMDDYNGDGKKDAQLNDFVFCTDEQYKELEEYFETSDEEMRFDMLENRQTAEIYTYEIFGGESMLCILARSQYDEVAAAEGFVPLRDIVGEIPEGAVDEFGVLLSETKLYKFYSGVRIFPDDAVIALRKLSTMSALTGKSKAEVKHGYHREMFRAILEFEYPAGYVPEE